MNTYIALFRGINVGGNRVLPMAALTTILEQLKLKNVKTYIQSGSVLFQSREQDQQLQQQIALEIQNKKGFKPEILLLSALEFRAAVSANPFATSVGKALHYFFLHAAPQNIDLHTINAVQAPTEEYAMANNVLDLLAPEGIGRSKLVPKIEKAVGVPVTGRNWNTVARLLTMAESLSM